MKIPCSALLLAAVSASPAFAQENNLHFHDMLKQTIASPDAMVLNSHFVKIPQKVSGININFRQQQQNICANEALQTANQTGFLT